VKYVLVPINVIIVSNLSIALQFSEVYPQMYKSQEESIPDHLRAEVTSLSSDASSKSSTKLRGLLKFASFATLTRNKHGKK